MSFKNKTVLVTGGAGFIGSHLVDKLLEQNVEKVTILDNFVSESKKNINHLKNNDKINVIEGDVRDFNTVRKLVRTSDYVFHEAASKLIVSLNNPRIDVLTNVLGTFNVLEAAKGSNTRIIHASTGSVFGSSNEPMSEGYKKNPTTIYGINKLAAESYCLHFAKEFGLKATVLRYFHVFGPRQDYRNRAGVVSIFLSRVLKNKPPIILSGGNQIRCFTYVSDIVDATLLLAKNKRTIRQDYNVASKTRINLKDLADVIINKYAKNKSMKPIYGPTRPGENMNPIPDTTKIENLGFKEKISFEEGLEKTKGWIEKDIN